MSLKPRHRRALWIAGALALLALATVLVVSAMRKNLVFFFSPSQVLAGQAPQGRSFRVGGLVEAGSLERLPDGMTVRFTVSDTVQRVPVVYRGALPDLFREGKGVVAQGTLAGDGTFRASEVLAKHDENYMPPEAKAALEQAQKGTTMPSLKTTGSAPK